MDICSVSGQHVRKFLFQHHLYLKLNLNRDAGERAFDSSLCGLITRKWEASWGNVSALSNDLICVLSLKKERLMILQS